MNIPHVVVKNCLPPNQGPVFAGRIYACGPQIQEAPQPAFTEDEESDAEAETKVVRRGRRPAPKATEGVETKDAG